MEERFQVPRYYFLFDTLQLFFPFLFYSKTALDKTTSYQGETKAPSRPRKIMLSRMVKGLVDSVVALLD